VCGRAGGFKLHMGGSPPSTEARPPNATESERNTWMVCHSTRGRRAEGMRGNVRKRGEGMRGTDPGGTGGTWPPGPPTSALLDPRSQGIHHPRTPRTEGAVPGTGAGTAARTGGCGAPHLAQTHARGGGLGTRGDTSLTTTRSNQGPRTSHTQEQKGPLPT
jgi:hypothetical protein